MFDNVIVGVDGSAGGRNALSFAKALAATSVTVVGAYPADPFRTRASNAAYERLIRDDTVTALEAARRDAGLDDAEIVAVGDNAPARALQQLAVARHADLLVVGASHRSAVGRVLLGDVGRGVVHQAPCPVAVVPHEVTEAPRTVGVGFDGTPEAALALEAAAGWVTGHDAVLAVCIAWDVPAMAVTYGPGAGFSYPELLEDARGRAEALREEAMRRAGSAPISVDLVQGRPTQALEELSERVGLLVVGSRGWGTLSRVAVGSTSDWLMHHAHCPVVVVPRPAQDTPAPDASQATAVGVG